METLYVMRGTSIRRKDNTLLVTLSDGRRRTLPVESIKHIVIPTGCHVTTDVLAFLSREGVRVSLINFYGEFAGSLEPSWSHAAGDVHLAQAKLVM
ncbi:MAG: CRISPR-associated endonuclease Cas1, partial [Alicyclobacillaceae bacterium]|nr:CRISPR-associated endonuclease Cas1 [Alicyclobacillaceae bacterium]